MLNKPFFFAFDCKSSLLLHNNKLFYLAIAYKSNFLLNDNKLFYLAIAHKSSLLLNNNQKRSSQNVSFFLIINVIIYHALFILMQVDFFIYCLDLLTCSSFYIFYHFRMGINRFCQCDFDCSLLAQGLLFCWYAPLQPGHVEFVAQLEF